MPQRTTERSYNVTKRYVRFQGHAEGEDMKRIRDSSFVAIGTNQVGGDHGNGGDGSVRKYGNMKKTESRGEEKTLTMNR